MSQLQYLDCRHGNHLVFDISICLSYHFLPLWCRSCRRRNNRKDRETGPQLLGSGTNNVLVPQLFGRSFQKARNFTASSRQNAGFSIWFFKNFPGWYPRIHYPDGLWRKRPGVGTQTLVPLNSSAVVASLGPVSFVEVSLTCNSSVTVVIFLSLIYGCLADVYVASFNNTFLFFRE